MHRFYYILGPSGDDVKDTTKKVTVPLARHLRRPTSGGTRQGQRPERYRYWRVGYSARPDQRLEFWVSQAGEYHGRAGYFYRATEWEQANWTQFYYFLNGRTRFTLSGADQYAGPGDLLVLPAGFTVEGQSDQEIRFHWFALQGGWPAALGSDPKVRCIPCGADPILVDRFVDLRETLILQRPGHPLQAIGIFYAILARLEARATPHKDGRQGAGGYPESIRNAVIFMQEHFDQPFDPSRIAAAAGISASHLRALFDRWLGESPRRYFTRLRIEEAARLLREQQVSVLEVAMKVGFRDRGNFSRTFKRWMGVAPSRFAAAQERD